VTGAQCLVTGRIPVGLPPAEAFRLFTPRGEQDWAPGWRPFPERRMFITRNCEIFLAR
jgi:hypothetical protein